MPSILRPITIALDTPFFGQLSEALSSKDSQRNRLARETFRLFEEQRVIAFLSLEQLAELLQHDNDAVAMDRIELLRRLPVIAHVKSTENPNALGSIFDVELMEVIAIVDLGMRDLNKIQAFIRSQCVRVTPNVRNLLAGSRADVDSFRDRVRARRERNREIASLTHFDIWPKILKMRVREIRSMEALGEFGSAIEEMKQSLRAGLLTRGDPKLSNPELTAVNFEREVYADYAAINAVIQSGSGSIIEAIAAVYGIDTRSILEDMTLEKLFDLGVYEKQLAYACAKLGRTLTSFDVPPILRPCWLVQSSLDHARKQNLRASGSDPFDSRLACLTLLAELTTVDKRVYHFLSQLEPQFAKLDLNLGRYAKLTRYSDMAHLVDPVVESLVYV